jgi:hypothetical protein
MYLSTSNAGVSVILTFGTISPAEVTAIHVSSAIHVFGFTIFGQDFGRLVIMRFAVCFAFGDIVQRHWSRLALETVNQKQL